MKFLEGATRVPCSQEQKFLSQQTRKVPIPVKYLLLLGVMEQRQTTEHRERFVENS